MRTRNIARAGSSTLNNNAQVPCQYAVQRHTPPNVMLIMDLGFREITKKHKNKAKKLVINGGTE